MLSSKSTLFKFSLGLRLIKREMKYPNSQKSNGMTVKDSYKADELFPSMKKVRSTVWDKRID